MTPLVMGGVMKLAGGLIGLADKVITDKDKKIEFQYRVMDRTYQFYETLITTPTNPKMDAWIKFILTVGTAFKGMLRPIGSFILTAGVLYMRSKGQALPEWLEIPIASAFPGWMISRHQEKKNKKISIEDDMEDW